MRTGPTGGSDRSLVNDFTNPSGDDFSQLFLALVTEEIAVIRGDGFQIWKVVRAK